MRIAQVILPNASEYERKCQRADFEALSGAHEVVVTELDDVRADVAHVYASGELPRGPFVGFRTPYVSSADMKPSRWPFGKPSVPDYVVSPIIEKIEQSRYQPLAEVVEDRYFAPLTRALSPPRRGEGTRVVGFFARNSIENAIGQTHMRLLRFRDDVEWHGFSHIPAPEDLRTLDVWIDPAGDESDFDGFVAEALVVGLPVVASRTKINTMRLEHGRTGMLVPPGDPNEMTHAILAALFKPEVAGAKTAASRQTIFKFKSNQRLRVLVHMYETLIS